MTPPDASSCWRTCGARIKARDWMLLERRLALASVM